MSLKIFGEGGAPQKKQSTASDVVGRFRSGYVSNDRPVAVTEWRATTGDPEVAAKLAELLDGEAPQNWDAHGEDNIEVFGKEKSVEVILEGPRALRQAMALYGRKGVIYISDGETITYPDERKGEADPQAGEDFATRKAKAREGTGAEPKIEVYFRLADEPDLGIFKFQSGSWSFVSDLAYHGVEDQINDLVADGADKIAATLALELVEFTAKNGPRAGQKVSYTKPVLTINGAA